MLGESKQPYNKGLSSSLKDRWYDFAKLFCSLVLRFPLFCRIKVEGRENLPEGAYIIASNHLSFLDPVLIGVSVNKKVSFLAKSDGVQKDEVDKSLYGRILKSLDQIILQEGYVSTHALKKSLNLLGNGKRLGVFAEGKRSYDGKLGKLEEGVAVLSDLSKIPVVPFYLRGSFEIWPRHKKFPKPFGKVVIRIEEPIYVRDIKDKRERRKDIMTRLEERWKYLESSYS